MRKPGGLSHASACGWAVWSNPVHRLQTITKRMNLIKKSLLASALLAVAAAIPMSAQTAVVDTTRRSGEREFTIGGSGASNRDFDSSLGGVDFSFGQYINETQLVTLRQSVQYANPNIGGQQWAGSTRIAFDQHFSARGALRPFIGANIGGIYGEGVRDTFTAGLEVGGKWYVQPKTFIFAMVDYSWLFRHARGIDDQFDDGRFGWNLGVGFNF